MRHMNLKEEDREASDQAAEVERSINPGAMTIQRFAKENADKVIANAIGAA